MWWHNFCHKKSNVAHQLKIIPYTGMYLEFKRNSVISGSSILSRWSGHFYSTGNLAGTELDNLALPEGISTSSLDSTRGRVSKPAIDRTVKPMSASVGGSIDTDEAPGQFNSGFYL